MFTKNFMGGGRVILWGKINPGKYLTGKLTLGNFSPIPQRKKKKIDSRKYYLLGKM